MNAVIEQGDDCLDSVKPDDQIASLHVTSPQHQAYIDLLVAHRSLWPLKHSTVHPGWAGLAAEVLQQVLHQQTLARGSQLDLRVVHYGAKYGGFNIWLELTDLLPLQQRHSPEAHHEATNATSDAAHHHTLAPSYRWPLWERKRALKELHETSRHASLRLCAVCGGRSTRVIGLHPPLCQEHLLIDLHEPQARLDAQVMDALSKC